MSFVDTVSFNCLRHSIVFLIAFFVASLMPISSFAQILPDGGTGSSTSIDDVLAVCEEEVGEYCTYSTCTNFANCVHVVCNQEGLKCKTLTWKCKEGGHAFNLVQDPKTGLWYVVEATSGHIHTKSGEMIEDLSEMTTRKRATHAEK